MTTAAGRVVLTFDIDDKGVVKGLGAIGGKVKDAGEVLRKQGQGLKDWGTDLTKYVTAPILGIGGAALAVGLNFEKSMNSIQGVLRPTAAQMERVRETAIKMGADTAFSATDAADAILELGKAGFDTDTAIASVDEVLQLAAASGLSMADSASMAARTLNAFGLEATDLGHVNDVLAKAVNATSLEIGDMQVAFGYVGPVANGFGLSIEQVSAALGIMRDNGIAAETTGRALREGFTRLVNPTKDVRDVMEELGIETFKTADGGMMDLSEIIGILEAKGIDTGQAMKMFGDAAGPGMAALVSKGKGALDDLTKQLEESDGAAKAMADAMMTGLPGAMERLKGSTETAFLSISRAIEPTAIMVMDKLGAVADLVTTSVVPAFMEMHPAGQAAAVGLVAVAAAAGPALVVAGQLVIAWSHVSKALGTTLSGAALMASRMLGVVGVASLREWVGNATNATGSTRALNTELDSLGRNASVWDKLRVVMRHWDTSTAGATTVAALLGRTFRKTAEDINLSAEATTTAAQRTGQAQQAMREQMTDLALRITNMRNSGESAASILESLGVEAKLAADGAKQLGIDVATVPPVVTELATAFQRQTAAARGAAGATVEVSEADKAATKAAEDLERAVEQQEAAIRALGLVTRKDVVTAMAAFEETLKNATAAGIPVERTLAAIRPKLMDLIADARESGIAVDDMVEALAELDLTVRNLRGIPQLSATISATVPQATALATGVRTITGAQMEAETQTYLTTRAFEYFGLTTREEYEQTVRDARANLRYLLESEEATAEQIAEARQRVVEAERRGRKESVSIWREYGREVLGIARDTANSFARAILGMSGQLAQENQRMADQARDDHERTQDEAADTLARSQEQARDEYNRTAEHVEDTYQRELTAAEDKYADLLAEAAGSAEEIRTVENWYAAERERIEGEKNAAILAAETAMNDAIAADVATTNAEIETSHAQMQAAIEQASHRFRDNMADVWHQIKDAFASVISDMLGDFINRFVGGSINALLGRQNAFGSAFAGMFGGGGAGATGAGAGAGASGAGVGAGVSVGTVAAGALAVPAAVTLGAMAYGWGSSFFGDHFTSPEAQAEQARLDAIAMADYTGAAARAGMSPEDFINSGGVPGFSQGGIVDAPDSGMPAIIHGRELIAPLPDGFDLAASLQALEHVAAGRESAGSGGLRVENRVYIGNHEIEDYIVETNLRAYEENDGKGALVGPATRAARALGVTG